MSAGRRLAGLEEVVPGHDTVLLRWEAGRRPPTDLAARIGELLGSASDDAPEADPVVIAVRYDGPDLVRVAQRCAGSVEEVVRRHQAGEYVVGFLGFAPGFAYLLGGDPMLRPPRLEVPRPRVPAGAVAVAGEYSAVYPAESPGGWNLIGTAGQRVVELTGEPEVRLAPGTRVRFTESAR